MKLLYTWQCSRKNYACFGVNLLQNSCSWSKCKVHFVCCEKVDQRNKISTLHIKLLPAYTLIFAPALKGIFPLAVNVKFSSSLVQIDIQWALCIHSMFDRFLVYLCYGSSPLIPDIECFLKQGSLIAMYMYCEQVIGCVSRAT